MLACRTPKTVDVQVADNGLFVMVTGDLHFEVCFAFERVKNAAISERRCPIYCQVHSKFFAAPKRPVACQLLGLAIFIFASSLDVWGFF